MEGNIEPHANKPSTSQTMPTEGQNQWSPLRGVYEGITKEKPALAVTTRAMRGSAPPEDEPERQENYSLNDVEPPHYPSLEKMANAARQTTRALARKETS